MNTNLPTLAPDADPAAHAFARLAEKVDLLEAAISGLAAKREAAPDYSDTLGEIAVLLQRMREAINTLARRPAMTLTPDEMARQIAAAGKTARAEDVVALAQARDRIDMAAGRIEYLAGNVATGREHRRLLWTAGGGLLAGILLWSVLPGTIARALPDSWQWPERMAARLLNEPTAWDAGERMLTKADPERWRTVLLANRILQDNRQEVAACLKDATRNGQPKRCTLTIKLPNPNLRDHRSQHGPIAASRER